ncbi:MAG: PAS domain-containing protein [Nitrospirae bacterium]|nr:PAS domain-containing protein [Nitrospirota bacterium]
MRASPLPLGADQAIAARVAVAVRLGVATGMLGLFFLAQAVRISGLPTWASFFPYYYCAYALAQLYPLRCSRRGRRPHSLFQAFNHTVDSVALTLLVFYTGGLYSPFLFVYILGYLAASILERARSALLIGLVQGLLFTLMGIGQTLGWLPIHALPRVDPEATNARTAFAFLMVFFLGAANLVVVYLFRRIRLSEAHSTRQYQKLNTLYALTRTLLGEQSLAQKTERICETVASGLGFQFGCIFLYNEERDTLDFCSCSPPAYKDWMEGVLGMSLPRMRVKLDRTDHLLVTAVQNRTFYATRDMRELQAVVEPPVPESAYEALLSGLGRAQLYAVPLAEGERLIGVLGCIGSDAPLAPEDRDTLISCADAAALAIGNAQTMHNLRTSHRELEESLEDLWVTTDKLKASHERIHAQSRDLVRSQHEVEESERELEGVYRSLELKHRHFQSAVDIAQSLHALTDPDHLAAEFATLLSRVFPGWKSAVFLNRNHRFVPAGAAGFDGHALPEILESEVHEALGSAPTGEVLEIHADQWNGRLPVTPGTDSGCAMPIRIASEWMGLFYFEGGQKAECGEDERSLLLLLAHQFGLALKNALHLGQALFYKNYLENLLENARAVVLVLNHQGRVQLFNRYAEEQTGYRRDEVVGKHAARLFVAEDRREDFMQRFTDLVQAKSLGTLQGEFRTKRGRTRKTVITIIPVLDAQGEVQQTILMGEDLTRIRELEQQVIEAGRLAALGQLAAAVAHDLSNPITVMSSQLELLKDDVAAHLPKASGRIQKAQAASEHVRLLIDNLMSYAKPGLERRLRLSLNEVVREALALSDYEIRRGGVKIKPELDESLPRVSGVKGELQQVVLNLLVNANRAIREFASQARKNEHHGEIGVRTRRMDEAHVCLSVEDNGIGIKADLLERIFEPFYTTWSTGEGSGLGLAAVRRIVERHSGRVEVESTHLKGSRFDVVLPIEGAPSPTPVDKPAGAG